METVAKIVPLEKLRVGNQLESLYLRPCAICKLPLVNHYMAFRHGLIVSRIVSLVQL